MKYSWNICLYYYDSGASGIKIRGSEHRYDYADVGGSDLSDRRRANQDAQRQGNGQEIIVNAVENPYYGGDGIENEPDGESNPGARNFVNVKVVDNPYYEM